MVKALRLKEATLRYSNGAAFDMETRARADGLATAIQIIDTFTRKHETGEE